MNNLVFNDISQKVNSNQVYGGRNITISDIERVLDVLRYNKPSLSIVGLSKQIQLPLSAVSLILDELEKKDFLSKRNGIVYLKKELIFKKTFNLNVISKQLKKIVKERHPAKISFDQCYATLETTIKRLKILYDNYDVQDKKVLILGDDDLLSIAISLLNVASEVTVAELDKDIVTYIKMVSNENNLPVHVIKYDVRDKFPRFLKNKFDTVFIDPPYTYWGITLFLSRCVQALKKEGRTIYLCYSQMDISNENILKLQKNINSMGLILKDIYPSFNEYVSREDMIEWAKGCGIYTNKQWFTSSLIRLEASSNLTPVIKDKFGERDIYEYEE